MPDPQLAALAALCDTFIAEIKMNDDPQGYWARSAKDMRVAERILSLIQQAKTEDRVQFEQLLRLIASPMLGVSWLGPLKPAHKLSPAQREKLLRKWAVSPISEIRNGYNALRKLTTLLYFGDIPEGKTDNPSWDAMDYQPVRQFVKPDQSPLPLFKTENTKPLSCDVLVIGSGCGGSIVAAQMAAAGQEVIVVEKGGYSPSHAFTQQEVPMLNQHFEAGGLLTSQDGSITVLAGSTLGGGGTINWAGSLRTPDFVLEEWATHGNPHFLEKDFQEGFTQVEKRNSVHTDIKHNPQNQALIRGAQALGYRTETIPINMQMPTDMPSDEAWKAAGFSCYGDAYNIKQGPVQTFLRDAAYHWAKILPNARAEKILIDKGSATGAEISITSPDTHERKTLTIKAKKVVVSAGALHTPVLLLKSGLQHPQIGQNLYLHPVATVAGYYTEDMRPWYGPMMTVVVQELARLDGNWGTRLECPPIHPGLAAFALGWEDPRQFKQDLLDIRKLAVFFSLTRDRYPGKVSVGKKSGEPIIHYQLHAYDKAHLLRGLQACARLQHAAGAERIVVPHNRPLRYQKEQALEPFLQKMVKQNWGANHFGLFSAHQMGTCRMGGNKDYPVKPNGETREAKNLFVADASLFPSASGANPMLSVQALALHVARNLLI
jgi:choline dehydrogenase-like flavoprotein